jgi:hypothetical protein
MFNVQGSTFRFEPLGISSAAGTLNPKPETRHPRLVTFHCI